MSDPGHTDRRRAQPRPGLPRRRLLALAAGAGGALALGAATAAHADTGSAGRAAPVAPTSSGPAYFPPATGEWERADPAARGWDAGRLRAALNLAGRRNSDAMLVVEGGRIIAERYWNGFDARSPGGLASVQKSVVAMLFGAVTSRTTLRTSDPVSSWLGAGWSGADATAEAAITCQHLLTMTSGLDEDLEVVAAPGTVWFYNTPAYAVLLDVLEAASGQDLQDLSDDALFTAVGATATWTARAGTSSNSRGLTASARDVARLGMLALSGEFWGGVRIIPLEWRDRMLARSQDLNRAYGLLWWLNGQDSFLLPDLTAPSSGPLIPAAPADLVAALGAGGQKLYVVPSRDLVVVRLGDNPGGGLRGFDDDLWQALAPALPA